jgi:hypothetical protein
VAGRGWDLAGLSHAASETKSKAASDTNGNSASKPTRTAASDAATPNRDMDRALEGLIKARGDAGRDRGRGACSVWGGREELPRRRATARLCQGPQ